MGTVARVGACSCALTAVLCAAPAAAQAPEWTQRIPTDVPRPRTRAAMTCDVARARTVLFGGLVESADFFAMSAETWEWDGATWQLRQPGAVPPARRSHAMTTDLLRGRTVLFGGQGQGLLAHTWEWDGNTWTHATPAHSPPAMSDHAMAYDVLRGHTVLFGGAAQNALLDDTWEWDGV